MPVACHDTEITVHLKFSLEMQIFTVIYLFAHVFIHVDPVAQSV